MYGKYILSRILKFTFEIPHKKLTLNWKKRFSYSVENLRALRFTISGLTQKYMQKFSMTGFPKLYLGLEFYTPPRRNNGQEYLIVDVLQFRLSTLYTVGDELVIIL